MGLAYNHSKMRKSKRTLHITNPWRLYTHVQIQQHVNWVRHRNPMSQDVERARDEQQMGDAKHLRKTMPLRGLCLQLSGNFLACAPVDLGGRGGLSQALRLSQTVRLLCR